MEILRKMVMAGALLVEALCTLLLLQATHPALAITPKHDCCWGGGCPGGGTLTDLVHQIDLGLLYPYHCSNYYFQNGDYHTGSSGSCSIGNQLNSGVWTWRTDVDCVAGTGCTINGVLHCQGHSSTGAPLAWGWVSFSMTCTSGLYIDVFDDTADCNTEPDMRSGGTDTRCECDPLSHDPAVICGAWNS